MEIRVLQYFLAVAKERNILAAAERLHISQPTLSRQLKTLEEELGKTLFIRGNRHITLTDEGLILRKRAEEVLMLINKTESEISVGGRDIAGDIHIGAVESEHIRIMAKAGRVLSAAHPNVRFHIIGGDANFVYDQVENGLLDFGLVFYRTNPAKCECLTIKSKETWGLLMPKNAPLAKKESLSPDDLRDIPLIVPQQFEEDNKVSHFLDSWLQYNSVELKIVATHSHLFGASVMVEEGLGYTLCFDNTIYTERNTRLCFRPLNWEYEVIMYIVWKKNQVMSKAAGLFLETLRSSMDEDGFLRN